VETILDSIRVVEMTEALAGPYCAMLLGDFGADVIKVERPGVGDQSRGWGPPFVGSESAYYLAANRNKRSIALNYDHPRGAAAWLETLAKADIPAAPINTVAGAIENPQTRARGLIVQLEHPAIGTAKNIANPIRFSNTPVSYRMPPPLLGEHTSAILQSLGFAAKDIDHMPADSAT
jgi:crotonobetainyl-CoA:carnitine CoA-transferase CaiB-like acyl-CoA transferase